MVCGRAAVCFFQSEDGIRGAHEGLEFRRVLFRSLVFAQHLECADQQYEQQQDRGVGDHGHGLPPSVSARGSTCSTRPSTARTRNRWPRRTGCPDLARQSSPPTCTPPPSLKSCRATAWRPIQSPTPANTGRFDRKTRVQRKVVEVRVDLGGGRI